MAKDHIDIRDLRDGKFLWIDKAALNFISKHAGNGGVVVYSWLCYYANAKQQNCFPSITTLAEHCNVSRRTIMRTVKTLERIQIITIERVKGKRNVYKLLNAPVDKPVDNSGDKNVTGDMGDTGVVTPVSLPLVTPGTLEQDLNKQELFNKRNTLADLWSDRSLPYENPTQQEITEMTQWCEKLIKTVNLYRLIVEFQNERGYPPTPTAITALCRQFDEEHARIKKPWAWFRRSVDTQMRQLSAKNTIDEHRKLKKEPTMLGAVLKDMVSREEGHNGSF